MSNGTLREREGGRKGGERERERERERECIFYFKF